MLLWLDVDSAVTFRVEVLACLICGNIAVYFGEGNEMYAAEEYDEGEGVPGHFELLSEDEAVCDVDAGQFIEDTELSPDDFGDDIGHEEVDLMLVDEANHDLQEEEKRELLFLEVDAVDADDEDAVVELLAEVHFGVALIGDLIELLLFFVFEPQEVQDYSEEDSDQDELDD